MGAPLLDNKGLTFSVIKEVEVREIVCGESTVEDIEKFHEWITKNILRIRMNLIPE